MLIIKLNNCTRVVAFLCYLITNRNIKVKYKSKKIL